MPDLDLCYLPASEALARFREKTLSPVELMKAVIDRAEAVEPSIGAFTYRYYEEALELARKAERKYARRAETGALEGLPVAIKDESFIEGLPTSNGSLALGDYFAQHTSPVNERILQQGGIVHARTATPEFSSAFVTWSKLWGVTRNPWNLRFTPGGSSGGAGASLAAGTSTLCSGSDIAGSIRVPASCCGVVGYKPPYGRNPEDPPFNLDFYNHSGPLARTVRDAILLQNVMAGPHPRDIASLKPKLTLPTEMRSIKGWKIACSMDLGFYELDDDVRRNTEAALDVFRALGASVEEVDLQWDRDIYEAGRAYLDHLLGAWIVRMHDLHGKALTTYVRSIAKVSRKSKVADFIHSLEVAGRMYATLGPLFERYNVLVCPTNAKPAVKADFDPSKGKVKINGRKFDPVFGWTLTVPFNMVSRCPVLSVPSGRASNGVPTGIQIVGASYCDADVFRAGLAYEKALGGWYAGPDARPAL